MKRNAIPGWLAVCAILLVAGCTTLPPVQEKPVTQSLPAADAGALSDIVRARGDDLGEDESAFLLVPEASEAMLWRLALIDAARQSIDAQYFIWKDDPSGTLMLEHLLAAADRGVQVRLLVDDMFLSTGGAFDGVDGALAAIDHHPNMQFRLFNPGKYRDGIMGLAGNFGTTLKTYNRRMHNKLMLFDGHFAIVGGRNIGDEYFGLYEHHNFLDLDVVFSGASISQVSAAFDVYWNGDLAYPTGALAPVSENYHLELRREGQEFIAEHKEVLAAYLPGIDDQAARLDRLRSSMHSGLGLFLQDKPVERGGREFRLYDMLNELTSLQGEELIVSSPYLIPVGSFLEDIRGDAQSGISVSLITNSLASNDAAAAHSHYKKYRRDLLETGADLYEFHHQPTGGLRELADVPPGRAGLVALHTKASSLDGKACFIGSLNMDPRSIEVNTENGLYIESVPLCSELHRLLTRIRQPENSWRVTLTEDGDLQWTSYEGTVSKQPAQGTGQRIADFFFRILPLESQM